MSTFYTRLIETALGISDAAPLLAIVADPRTCLPDATEMIVLPATESYPADLQRLLAEKKPQRLFLVPPFLRQELVPEAIRAEYPRWNYEAIGLLAALEGLPDGATVAAIMPTGFFQGESGRSVRSRVFANYPPKLLITHANSLQEIFPHIHAAVRFNTLTVGVGSAERSIRFFKCLEPCDAMPGEEIVADLARLLKQGGGRTKQGYVVREGLPPDAPLVHELYDPAFITKQQSIAAIGEVRQLSDVAEIRAGLHVGYPMQISVGAERVQNIRVISGRDIGPNGAINVDDVEDRAEAPTDRLLQKGDLCIASISRGRIRLAEVTEDILPAIANQSVVFLRFKPGLSSEVRQTLVAFLRSPHALEQLRARAPSMADAIRFTPRALAELPVPVLDEELSTALRDVNNSIDLLRGWADEAARGRDALFEFANPKGDRLTINALGRLYRQRCDAAKLVDDLRHRIRTQYPYPVAFRWRTVEASLPDVAGVKNVLACAEVATCYLACMGLLLPSVLPEFKVKYAGEFAKRKSHGTNWGDWISIVREVKEAKPKWARLEALPFGELAAWDDETDQALTRLSKVRNSDSHLKEDYGSEVEVTNLFETCRRDLELFLEGIEFVTEYRLRIIEKVNRDTRLNRMEYQYRELMGDHPLVPVQTGHTNRAELENSLYLADRNGELHLLRPFMNWLECPECKRRSVFYLDTYSKKENKCFLKSMEHGHTANADASTLAAFQHVGLLPS